jgi:hypothetical protein
MVNGNTLDTEEEKHFKWISQFTVPNFGMSWYAAIRDYSTLQREQVQKLSLGVVEEQRTTSVYGQDVPTVLGRSAQQAGYVIGTAEYTKITQATGYMRKEWLLKSHLVGFYFVASEVNDECLIPSPESRCYGTHEGNCDGCARYAPDAASTQTRIDEVMVLLQSLNDGTAFNCLPSPTSPPSPVL